MPDPTGWTSHIPEFHRGVAWKQPVACATTANITLSGTQTIDGHAVVAGERVLVKNQSSGAENGIWVCSASAWARAFDMDQDDTTAVPAEEVLGAKVYVVAGTVNGGTTWRCTNTAVVVLGTNAITWALDNAGAAAALGDLTDVDTAGEAAGDRLRFDGTTWKPSGLIWKNVMVLDPTSGNYLPVTTGAGEAVYTETL